MQIVEANKRNETKTFFEEVKYFNQQESTLPSNCTDSENNVISKKEQYWKHGKNIFIIFLFQKRH